MTERLKERDIILAIETPISDRLNDAIKDAIKSIAQIAIVPECFVVLNAEEC